MVEYLYRSWGYKFFITIWVAGTAALIEVLNPLSTIWFTLGIKILKTFLNTPLNTLNYGQIYRHPRT